MRTFQLRLAYRNLQRTTIVSPVDCTVGRRSVQIGQQISGSEFSYASEARVGQVPLTRSKTSFQHILTVSDTASLKQIAHVASRP